MSAAKLAKRILLAGVIGLAASTLLLIATGYVLISGLCGYEVYDTKVSPDRAVTATLLEVNCGATTGYATWVLLSKSGKAPSYRRDRVAAFEGYGGTEWVSSDVLMVMTSQELLNIKENRFGINLITRKELEQ